jgi:putative transposase
MAERPNELWVADITFLPTLAGFLYLAVVLDAWSRRIVGWAFSADLKTRVLDALDMALVARKPDNVVHHWDSQRINASFRAA